MNWLDAATILVLLLALVAIATLATSRWHLKAENQDLRERNAWQANAVKKYVGNSICDVKWRSLTVTSEGVPVGLDPTERLRVSLEAEGKEAEKVVQAFKDANQWL